MNTITPMAEKAPFSAGGESSNPHENDITTTTGRTTEELNSSPVIDDTINVDNIFSDMPRPFEILGGAETGNGKWPEL